MISKFSLVLLLIFTLAILSTSGANQDDEYTKEWKFRVLLDDKDIGHHHFKLTEAGSERIVESQASFDARVFLFLNFRYQHSNTEIWRDECLVEIESETSTNGKQVALRGLKYPDGFLVKTNEEEKRLPACVKTFAYWDKELLEEGRLMNQQTGRYQEIDIRPMDTEQVTVQGKPLQAKRYRLTGEKVELDVWYSMNGEWLQLESKVRGGRTLRYQLT